MEMPANVGVHAKVAKIRSAPRRKIPDGTFLDFCFGLCGIPNFGILPCPYPSVANTHLWEIQAFGDDGSQEFAKVGFSEGAKGRWDQSPELAECRDAAKPHGPETGLLGRPAAFRNVGWEGQLRVWLRRSSGMSSRRPSKRQWWRFKRARQRTKHGP